MQYRCHGEWYGSVISRYIKACRTRLIHTVPTFYAVRLVVLYVYIRYPKHISPAMSCHDIQSFSIHCYRLRDVWCAVCDLIATL